MKGTQLVIERLEELAVESPAGLSWHTPALCYLTGSVELHPMATSTSEWHWYPRRDRIPGSVYFPGRSEGVCQPVAEGIHEVASLAAASTRCRIEVRHTWIVPGAPTSRESKLAWCYGDPGVATAILSAGLAVHEPTWIRIAMDIMKNCVERTRNSSGITDAGLCHGSAGVAHILNRFFQASHDGPIRDAARECFAKAIDMGTANQRSDQVSAHPATTDPGSENDDGLLTGCVGVGLALLAALTSELPNWDRSLLLSLPVNKK